MIVFWLLTDDIPKINELMMIGKLSRNAGTVEILPNEMMKIDFKPGALKEVQGMGTTRSTENLSHRLNLHRHLKKDRGKEIEV